MVGRRNTSQVPGGRSPADVCRRWRWFVLCNDWRLGERVDRISPGDTKGCAVTRMLLDPTNERTILERSLLPRPTTLDGKTVGLLDISKPRGDVFLDRLEQRLTDVGARVLRFKKPTFTKPAPVDLRHEIATKCEVVIEALAD